MTTGSNGALRPQLHVLMADAMVQVVFAFKESPTVWHFARVPLFDGLQEQFREKAESFSELISDQSIRNYDPEREQTKDEIYELEASAPPGGNFFEAASSFATIPEYENRRRVKAPNVWVIIAQLSDGTVAYFGARIVPSSVLGRSNVLRMIYKQNAFDELDDTVISFKGNFDWVLWKDTLFINDVKSFHVVFRDIPALEAKVGQHLTEIQNHIGIDNVDEFAERIKGSPRMMVKLQRIIERSDMHIRPADELRKYGIEFNIPVDWNGDKMVFDGTVQKQWNLLTLLDEAHTLGPVTGKHWDTSSKSEV